ncbi:MAG TPA: hypothetical protein VLX09_26670 [Stellaceae bacterium]|nr:hypothetical protein [Stellaceae bacterium]
MDHGFGRPCGFLANDENKTGTILTKSVSAASPEVSQNAFAGDGSHRCAYVTHAGLAGAGFCDEPTASGSSYCGRHRRLCTAAPASIEGRALAEALRWEADHTPEPPPEFAFLHIAAVPEPSVPEDRRALLALLDYPPSAEPRDGE